jgi:hypothetical protein
MRGSIREKEFTWNPHHESRTHVRLRIMRYVTAELDRIHEESKRHTQLMRRLESPSYLRDQVILRAFEEEGRSLRDLARRHGISKTRVREILRVQWHHRDSERFSRWLPQAAPRMLPCRTPPELPAATPQTRLLPPDP